MADIILINPPVSSWGKVEGIRKVSPPLGILSLAAFLEGRGYKVNVYDLALGPGQMDPLLSSLKSGRAGIVGITSTTSTLNSALKIAEDIKKKHSGIFVVFGGPHPTIRPEDLLEKDYVDCVVRGEGELTFSELCSRKLNNENWRDINGIAFTENGNLKINPLPDYIRDLDALPFPARHLVSFRRYGSTPVNYKRLPSTPVITSRGCPFQCTFCSNPVHGKQTRFRGAENIIGELILLKEKYGIRDVVFWDDTFTLDRSRIERICQLMNEEKLNLSWSCATRVDTVDRNILKMMKESGCWQVSFGVESGVDRLRQKIKKNISEEQIVKTFENCRKLNIETRAFFMLGIPSETREESLRTIEFAKRLEPDFAQFTLTVPYPGCELFEEATAQGWVPPKWENFQTYPKDDPVYVTEGRFGGELADIQTRAFRSFYLRFKYVFNRLKKIRSYEEFKKYLILFLNMLRW